MAALGGLAGSLICRSIEENDLDSVVDCLCRGFPARSRAYWKRGFANLAGAPHPDGLPKYGYALFDGESAVGAVLMIFARPRDTDTTLRCNLSSWCVDPEYRSYAPRLIFAAFRQRGVTFTNVSPARETWDSAPAFRFQRYCDGQFAFLPILSRTKAGDRAFDYHPDLPAAARLPEDERQLLAEHAALGCAALVCVSGDDVFPVVLQQKYLMNRLPAQLVVYCRDIAELPLYAGALGRHLFGLAGLVFVIDANGPVDGLVGRFFPERGPKYYRGAEAPRLGDLAYSEFAYFGD